MKESPKSTKGAFGEERREGGASSGTSGGADDERSAPEKDEGINEELDPAERPTTERPA